VRSSFGCPVELADPLVSSPPLTASVGGRVVRRSGPTSASQRSRVDPSTVKPVARPSGKRSTKRWDTQSSSMRPRVRASPRLPWLRRTPGQDSKRGVGPTGDVSKSWNRSPMLSWNHLPRRAVWSVTFSSPRAHEPQRQRAMEPRGGGMRSVDMMHRTTAQQLGWTSSTPSGTNRHERNAPTLGG
jgi:hypothetical protein